ncbi:Indole-3-acetic acid-induced protein ARG7 [Hibiscus syriacus]|uniref:Indole-3-acetic acid-induced protein ARG7 n=1 Tax=Hibiscus syriacus TaxID=106335 RepID=A0A6A2XAP7_HIBSY|nr:auxin-induced protein 15A-like [Hibiscus syriacus]KAE8672651.1 Indole-3-acetic acid-induced protein ARG7 [Hibiscus syriacus]
MGFRLPRIVNAKRILGASSPMTTDVPRGYFAVYVGENQKRFVIPVSYLNNPSFQELLSRSEEEFGYVHPTGGLRIPCGEDAFVHLTSRLA